MSTREYLLLTVAEVAVVCGLVSACAGPGEPTAAGEPDCQTGSSLTLLVSVHQGAAAPSVPQEWECPLVRAIADSVPINVVTIEGTPTVVLNGFRAELSTVDPSITNDDLIAAENQVIGAVKAAQASSDGSNLLGALALAGDLATSAGPGGQVLVVDNGLTDTGWVRVSDPGMTEQSGEDVAAWVAHNGQCPNLTDTTVTFYGLAYEVDPQPALSSRQRNAVTTTWVAIAKTCGATASSVPLPRTSPGPTTTFTTAVVAPEPEQTLAPTAACRVEIDDVVLGFLPESDRFVDEPAAIATIQEAARHISSCPGRITVIGTTSSWGTPAGRAQISTDRATRVRDVLARALGVSSTQIEARGVGYDPAYCVEDRVNGFLDLTLAQKNRQIIVTVDPT